MFDLLLNTCDLLLRPEAVFYMGSESNYFGIWITGLKQFTSLIDPNGNTMFQLIFCFYILILSELYFIALFRC